MNRPSLPLTVTIMLVVVIGLVLPYWPAADRLGLRSLPLTYFLFLSIAVTTYLVIVEAVKSKVIRRKRREPLVGKAKINARRLSAASWC